MSGSRDSYKKWKLPDLNEEPPFEYLDQIPNSSMASSSSSSHSPVDSSLRSCKYDVFLSFRGEDTRKTFVDHLYSKLEDHLIRVYKVDISLPRGESIDPSLFEAIEESRIAIIIFSKNYANSSWCLEELVHIMKCREERNLIVIPVFYDVEPTDVRNQKRKFGEAFAEQEAKNTTKAEKWRQALVDVSKISGWEPKNIANGHESQLIKKIVDTILDKFFSLRSGVDEHLVGMRERLQHLESLLGIGSNDVRMVGIWGLGGSGKTTLATSLRKKISKHFHAHCIVENVRDKTSKDGLAKLQENMLSGLFNKKEKISIHSVAEGMDIMKTMLCRRKVLVIIDDVSDIEQLEALVGNHNWFGSGSRIIITTRDEHLLSTHRVKDVYHVVLLSHDEAIQLFKRHAYNENDPIEDYETLSLRVISYCAGLALAIKVLGSFLYDKNKNQWKSTLHRLNDIPEMKIVEKLKISYDGLETLEKELFLDIACFFRHHPIHSSMVVLEACGYHPTIGIKVLTQKALITIVNDRFDMHDLVQEMGHNIVRGEHPNNPEKHSRLWKHDEVKEMLFQDEIMEYDKIEALEFTSYSYNLVYDISSHLCKTVSKMKKLRLLKVYTDNQMDENAKGANFLSNKLRCIIWTNYPASPFPDSFQPMNLVVLVLYYSKQKELWENYKHLPHLKVLELGSMWELLSTPSFDGLPCLKKLSLNECYKLEEIHPSHGRYTTLEYLKVSSCENLKWPLTISHMKNLKNLLIPSCELNDGEIPSGIGELSNLEEIDLSDNNFSRLDFSLSQLTRLKRLNLTYCHELLELPELPSSLCLLLAQFCESLTILNNFYKNCTQLCEVSLEHIDGCSDGLLQFMLKENAIKDCYMCLRLKGFEIPKGFTPMLRGTSCGLELPENWCNDFSGFLICLAFSADTYSPFCDVSIRMKQVQESGIDYEDDMVWEESDVEVDDYFNYTFVLYVPFDSLRHSAWWYQTCKALTFQIDFCKEYYSGIGVRLVEKKSRSGQMEPSTGSSSHYKPKIKFKHDSTSELRVTLSQI